MAESTEEPKAKLTKTGQKPRVLSEHHLERLKEARAKARITQIKNTELRKLERENKKHDDTIAQEEKVKNIKTKNKKIKEVTVEHVELPTSFIPIDDDDDTPVESLGDSRSPLEEPVKKVTKKKPKKKPVIIVEESGTESSDEEQQVIYIKKKPKKKVTLPEVSKPIPIPVPVKQEPEPPLLRRVNPFFNTTYKRY